MERKKKPKKVLELNTNTITKEQAKLPLFLQHMMKLNIVQKLKK